MEATAATPEAVAHLDDAVTSYLGFGRDTGQHLKAALTADPAMPMALLIRGYFFQLFGNPAVDAKAQQSLDAAEKAMAARGATARERDHAAALACWRRGDLAGATALWEKVLLESPRDVMALRLAHFTHFYSGRSREMRDSAARVLHAWDEGVRDYGFVLGVHAFGLEESGDYVGAERKGREAVERNPFDVWAIHAVAHVMEMQGRFKEGVDWLARTEAGLAKANNFAYHVWWHRAMFLLELERFDEVLAIYDAGIRGEKTDDYLDIANGAAMLQRLEDRGVDVGERWTELADLAEKRVDDHLLVFADAHFALALAAGGREAAMERLIASMETAAARSDTQGPLFAEIGLPLCAALRAYRKGDYGRAVDLLLPIRYGVERIGGSHAQRDLFRLMLIEASLRCGRTALARALLTERIAERPGSAWSWKALARSLDDLGDAPAAARARSEAARLLG
jgi:tetratricopeptide (TPR) repeat protein